MHNGSVVDLFETILVSKIEQKQTILCQKRFNINFLFTELFYKINITFAIAISLGQTEFLLV